MAKIKGKQIESVSMSQTTMPDKLVITSDVGEIKIPEGENYTTISKLNENGKEKTAWELLKEIFSKDNDPIITQPSVAISTYSPNGGYVESGSIVSSPSLTLKFNKGNYQFGSVEDGVEDPSHVTPEIGNGEVSFELYVDSNFISSDATVNGYTGTFVEKQIRNKEQLKINGKIKYNDSTNVPLSQLGTAKPDLKITGKTISISKHQVVAKSYMKIFYGGSSTELSAGELTSAIIRSLPNSTTTPYSASTTLSATSNSGDKCIIVAIPTSYITTDRKGVKAVAGNLGMDLTNEFVEQTQTIKVKDAGGNDIEYKLWIHRPASITPGNPYTITLA